MSQEVGPHESHQICWHCGFGLPRLQKEMFDVYEFPCLWYLLQQPSGTKTKFCLFQCLKSTSCFTNNLLVPTPQYISHLLSRNLLSQFSDITYITQKCLLGKQELSSFSCLQHQSIIFSYKLFFSFLLLQVLIWLQRIILELTL